MAEKYDLRKVLAEIQAVPGQYHETDKEIDPDAELAGVYRYIAPAARFSGPRKKAQR